MRAIFVFNSKIQEEFIYKKIDELKERSDVNDSDPLELQIMVKRKKSRLRKEIERVYETDDNVVIFFENLSSYNVSSIAHGQLKDLIQRGKIEIRIGEPLIILTKEIDPAEALRFNALLTAKEYYATMMSKQIKKSLINEKL
jgi:hypothetical protein